jgi:hypothetical protein
MSATAERSVEYTPEQTAFALRWAASVVEGPPDRDLPAEVALRNGETREAIQEARDRLARVLQAVADGKPVEDGGATGSHHQPQSYRYSRPAWEIEKELSRRA